MQSPKHADRTRRKSISSLIKYTSRRHPKRKSISNQSLRADESQETLGDVMHVAEMEDGWMSEMFRKASTRRGGGAPVPLSAMQGQESQ